MNNNLEYSILVPESSFYQIIGRNQVFDDAYQESDPFRRKCSYKAPEMPEHHKIISFNSKQARGKTIIQFNSKEKFSSDNDTLEFEGPIISTRTVFDDIEESNSEIDLGYIQTINSLNRRDYTNGTSYKEFQYGVMNKKVETLDIMIQEKQYKPFYSELSRIEIPRGKMSPDEIKKIKISLNDRPISKTNLNCHLGRLRAQEIYLKGCVRLVMRSRNNSKERWIYVVLHSFHWHIYWKWASNNRYDCVINYHINENETARDLPQFIKDGVHQYICNEDQFVYSIDSQGKFQIEEFPRSIENELKGKKAKKRFCKDIKKLVIKREKITFQSKLLSDD